jgi:hypothetical protein
MALKMKVMKMTENLTQRVYANGNSSEQQGARDGFQEQKMILSRLSQELDEYFSLRTIVR